MLLRPTYLPDAFVWLGPNRFHVGGQRALHSPTRRARGKTAATRVMKGIRHFTVHVQL